jgi:signal transduction histidine kinase/CheY-like chemotaxis protein
MDDLPRSLKWLTRIVRGSTGVAAAFFVVGTPLFWTQPELVRDLATHMSGMPESSMVIDQRATWLAFLGSLPLVAVSLFGLWQLWCLFGQYQAGYFFQMGTQRYLRRFALALLLATVLIPIENAWLSIAFTAGMPEGQRNLQIALSLDIMLPLLAGAVLLAVAVVLSEASRIAERSRELEIASVAKTRFLAAASHDLRQPVVSISLLSELLREQPLPATAIPLMDRIGDSVQALNHLLKGLLDLSRFEAGVVHAHPTRVALRPLLIRAIGDETEAARRKGIALRMRAAPLEIHSDSVLLEQILRNLVGNAVRYTRRGGVLVSARRRRTHRVLLQVWDTGPGIPVQRQSVVFEEFVQLQADDHGRAGGLGLGLSLVRRAADLLGAPLALTSVVGRGSCFSIELPMAGFEAAAGQVSTGTKTGLQGRQVWVVEDDPGVRDSLRMRLIGWGATVRDFGDVASVRRALDCAPHLAPDLLLSDQCLPDGTGVEVAQLLRSVAATLPVLLVTGETAPHEIAIVHSSGLPVLHKPFTSEGLFAAVRALGIADMPTADSHGSPGEGSARR